MQFPSRNMSEKEWHIVKSCYKKGLGICPDEYIEIRMNTYSWHGKILFMSMAFKISLLS